MTELEKFNLMLQGGYNPMGGGITTNQMEDFKTAGLFNQIQDTNNLISSLNIPNNPNPVPNTADEDLLKRQKRANMLIAFGDLLRGKDATAGFTQRQAMFDAERELEERKAKQEQRLKDQEEFIKNNPQFEQMIRFNQLFDMDMPQPKKRDSYVAKDGYRYFVDGKQERVFPNVTVKEEQSQADIYKENAARIKNIVLKEGPDSKNLTDQEKAFYDDYINKKGIMTLDQVIAAQLQGEMNNQNTPVKYRVINRQYGSLDAEQIIDNAQNYNPSLSREEIIQQLISNNIIAE